MAKLPCGITERTATIGDGWERERKREVREKRERG